MPERNGGLRVLFLVFSFFLRLAVWPFEAARRWGPLELRVRSKRGVGGRFGFDFGFWAPDL
jgi:hypothetical protein